MDGVTGLGFKGRRKVLILLGIAITAIAIVVSIVVFGQFWKSDDLRIAWALNSETITVWVSVRNYGTRTVNVTRVELIYVPEDIALIWIELHTLEPDRIGHGFESSQNENGASEFFNLLWESRWEGEGKVKIIVETTKAIYTFIPPRFVLTGPTMIEKKARALASTHDFHTCCSCIVKEDNTHIHEESITSQLPRR